MNLKTRVMKLPASFDSQSETKFVLRKKYKDYDIYYEITPTGSIISQSYVLSNTFRVIQIPSYNNLCLDEIYDLIDKKLSEYKFDLRVFVKKDKEGDKYYLVHPEGDLII